MCILEYIYLARPDSVICGRSVHKARRRAGRLLARESGVPYGVGLVKNRYIGHTFIAPGQDHGKQAVRIKVGG